MAEDIEKEGKEYVRSMIPFAIFRRNWENADRNDYETLRIVLDEMASRGTNIAEEMGLDQAQVVALDDFRQLLKDDDAGMREWLVRNGACFLDQLAGFARTRDFVGEPYDIEMEKVVCVNYAGGGPSFDIEFRLDREGDLRHADAVYRNWGEYRERLPESVAEALWENYSHLAEDDAPDFRNRM